MADEAVHAEGSVTLTVVMASGKVVFGPQQVECSSTIRQLRELVQCDLPAGSTKDFLLGSDVLADDKTLAECGCEVSLTLVGTRNFEEQFALLKQLCGNEPTYTRHPTGRWVIVEIPVKEFHSDSTNPTCEEGSQWKCFDLAQMADATLPTAVKSDRFTLWRSRGGWSGSSEGKFSFTIDGPPALVVERYGESQRFELAS